MLVDFCRIHGSLRITPAVAAGNLVVWVCAAGLFVCILRSRVFQPRKPAGIAPATWRGEPNDE